MKTEVGKIANLLENAENKQTPLQHKLDDFGKKLGVAIAVAAIPEALSSIVTVVLSVGTNIMAKKQAVIRKLSAVETLGSTSVICTDKTGTLTQNKMTVVNSYMYGIKEGRLDENISCKEVALDNMVNQEWDLSLSSILCNDSDVTNEGVEIGDLTEVALINKYKSINEEFSNKALRVLAFASKDIKDENFVPSIKDECDLTLIGIMAMIDPPREEVCEAVAGAKNSGIKTVMITGNHKTTAAAIAKDIGIMVDGDLALTGQELDALSDLELDEKLEKISVYARVSPENKIRIVKAWQRKGKVCAMTGDGVNDAPALKQADIGIGMGSGTEVAKDASAMVLLDDNFSTIVSSIVLGAMKQLQKMRTGVIKLSNLKIIMLK